MQHIIEFRALCNGRIKIHIEQKKKEHSFLLGPIHHPNLIQTCFYLFKQFVSVCVCVSFPLYLVCTVLIIFLRRFIVYSYTFNLIVYTSFWWTEKKYSRCSGRPIRSYCTSSRPSMLRVTCWTTDEQSFEIGEKKNTNQAKQNKTK